MDNTYVLKYRLSAYALQNLSSVAACRPLLTGAKIQIMLMQTLEGLTSYLGMWGNIEGKQVQLTSSHLSPTARGGADCFNMFLKELSRRRCCRKNAC